MYLKFLKNQDKLIVNLYGELDHHYSDYIRCKIDDRIDRDNNIKTVILNFENVTFMDSSGIGVVVGRYKKIKSKYGDLCIVNVKDNVNKVFEISGLLKIINYYHDVSEALKYV